MKNLLILVALALISFVTFAQQKTFTVNSGFWKVKMGHAASFVDASETFLLSFFLQKMANLKYTDTIFPGGNITENICL